MRTVPTLIMALIIALSLSPRAVFASEENIEATGSSISIARMVIAGSIVEREPVGVVNAFSSDTEKVYCFLEVKDVETETVVSFVWYHAGEKKAAVELPLGKSPRWRTYSSKKLGGLKGEWKVELQDANGAVLNTVAFTVE